MLSKISKANLELVGLGLVRNCEKTIQPTIKSVEAAVYPFVIKYWILVESDSTDNSLEVLQELQASDPRFRIYTLGKLSERIPDRIQRIGFCREFLRKKLLATEFVPDKVLVVDMDGVASGLSRGSISKALVSYPDLSMISANSRGLYYDILALRRPKVLDCDYREIEQALLEQGKNLFYAKFKALVENQIFIPQQAKPIIVNSAFGGLAVYDYECMKISTYTSDQTWECEHVVFHRKLALSGFKLGIVPELRVRRQIGHTFFSYKIFWPFWKCLAIFPKTIADKLAKRLGLRAGLN